MQNETQTVPGTFDEIPCSMLMYNNLSASAYQVRCVMAF